MKTILFIIFAFPVMCFSQISIDSTIIGYGITISNKLSNYRSPSFIYEDKIDTIIYKIENTGDELRVYKKWREYKYGYGPFTSCGVLGCESDHKEEVRIREVYGVGLDRGIQYLRTDTAKQIFEEQKKTITETITKWSFE